MTTFEIEKIEELEPTRHPEIQDNPDNPEESEEENLDPDAGKSQQQVLDEMTGQLRLFPDDEN